VYTAFLTPYTPLFTQSFAAEGRVVALSCHNTLRTIISEGVIFYG
jgi:hypothetical protein